MTNWETCVQFHGHACGGLTIGYKAARRSSARSRSSATLSLIHI